MLIPHFRHILYKAPPQSDYFRHANNNAALTSTFAQPGPFANAVGASERKLVRALSAQDFQLSGLNTPQETADTELECRLYVYLSGDDSLMNSKVARRYLLHHNVPFFWAPLHSHGNFLTDAAAWKEILSRLPG